MSRESVVLESWTQQVKEIRVCRICGNPQLELVIDLGRQAVAGLFNDGRPENQLETPLPLEVVRCHGQPGQETCGFVQLRHTVPPSILYRDYGYRSGINTTMRHHLEDIVRDIEARVPLRAGDVVVDIGANDGTLLLAYQQAGLVKVGFEPSNIRPEAEGHGIHYLPTIFSAAEFTHHFQGRQAKVVSSVAMFYDVETPRELCRDVWDILADDGVWIIEMSYLGAMLKQTAFDAICHEHLGYYSLHTLRWLVEREGFVFHDITFNEANGGSVRCTLVKRAARRTVPAINQQRIARAFQHEVELGHDGPACDAGFQDAVHHVREELRSLLDAVRTRGQRVFGYGASTKGNVLLQYCGIGPEDLMAIADRNPAKVGRKTSGSQIPICSEEQMRAAHPDYLLILPWHFLDEFLERERPLREAGMRFIVPLPQVRIV